MVLFACLLVSMTFSQKVAAAAKQEQPKEQNLLEKVKSSGVLHVGTSAEHAPWAFKDEQDNYVGHDMDLIREIAKRMGVKLELTDMSFDALVAAVQTGKVDLAICAMGAKEERKRYVDFSQMYHQALNAYAAQSDSSITITSKEGIAAYRVGAQSGTLEEQYITELVDAGKMKENQIAHYEKPENMFLDLINGRVQVVASSIDLIKEFMKTSPIKIIWEGSIYGTGENIAVPKNQPEFLAEINRVIDELRNDGYLARIDAAWGL
jgi:polar amino acid transport system substrate-binding protein